MAPRNVVLAIFALASGLLWMGQAPTRSSPSHVVKPPALPGIWEWKPLAVDPRTVEILETDEVLLREYRLGEEPPVWFAQVGGFGNRAAFHPPELCFVGSHFEVLEREPITVIANGKPRRLMRLVIGQDNERFEAWYWFTASGRQTPSYYQQQLWLVMETIRRRPASGTLVRISTLLDEPARSRRRLLAFLCGLEGQRESTLAHAPQDHRS